MVTEESTTVHCSTCGTDFSSADAAAVKAHAGHSLEHVEQA